jgi:hypothetical protein
MANWFNISCAKATYLLSKKQESGLAVAERIQLAIHITICDVCKLFKIQITYITKCSKNQSQEEHYLSSKAKQSIKAKVDEVISS